MHHYWSATLEIKARSTNNGDSPMKKFEYKVNGETFFSETQIIDAGKILIAAYEGKAIGKNPDENGYRLNVAGTAESFVSGDQVDLEKFNIFRAFPDEGAPFSSI